MGTHVASFASGLRAALRENPDVLLVGEMRDAETIRLTSTAAQTGHLVLSTLHSGSAVMAIERIVDVFNDSEKLHVRQELAVALRHVVAQQLLPTAGGGRLPALAGRRRWPTWPGRPAHPRPAGRRAPPGIRRPAGG